MIRDSIPVIPMLSPFVHCYTNVVSVCALLHQCCLRLCVVTPMLSPFVCCRLVNAMVYYGLALGTDNLGGDPYINFMIAGAVEIPAYIMCVLLLNRVGRKKPLTVTMIFGGISCIASAFVPKGLYYTELCHLKLKL